MWDSYDFVLQHDLGTLLHNTLCLLLATCLQYHEPRSKMLMFVSDT